MRLLLVVAILISMVFTKSTHGAERDFLANRQAADVISSGTVDRRLASFDHMMVSFVAEQQVPGASLAVTKNGRLVYARSFGYADLEARRPVTPGSLFRIASISKPITAVAILQLVENKRLRLEDKVFDLLQVEPLLENGQSVDPRLKQITVLQLLRHMAGWDRNVSFDPMFRSVDIATRLNVQPPAEPIHIMRYMMGKKLDFDPGERYAYSNYGYCLLGRLLEKITGTPYDQHVKNHVLGPLGIRDMRIGRTLAELRSEQEVTYYDEKQETGTAVLGPDFGHPVPQPYGAWYLEAMDSHGAWIASAVDLVRFAAALDSKSRKRLLRPQSLQTIAARPQGLAGYDENQQPKTVYYGCGWMIRDVGQNRQNLWHTGSLPGTSTILVRRHDGLHWAVLFNSRNGPNGKRLSAMIDPLVHQAADSVTSWPAVDYFRSD